VNNLPFIPDFATVMFPDSENFMSLTGKMSMIFCNFQFLL